MRLFVDGTRNQGAAANPDQIGTVRSSVAGVRKSTVRSTAATEAVVVPGRYMRSSGVNEKTGHAEHRT